MSRTIRRRLFVATKDGLAIVYKEEVMTDGVVVELNKERMDEILRTALETLSEEDATFEQAIETALFVADTFAQEDVAADFDELDEETDADFYGDF